MSHSRQDRYLEPGGGTGLQLAPGEGWPGQSPPQGKVGFQELAGWQAMGSPEQVSHTLPSSVLRMPLGWDEQREVQVCPWLFSIRRYM